MALLAAACRKSVPWLNCGWLLPVDGGGLSHLEEGDCGDGDDIGSQDICHHYDHDDDCVVVEDEDMEEAILGEFECIPLQV